jgi:hypothetical protein
MVRKVGVETTYEFVYEGETVFELRFRFIGERKKMIEDRRLGLDIPSYHLPIELEEELGAIIHGIMSQDLEDAESKMVLLQGMLKNFEELQEPLEKFALSSNPKLTLAAVDFRFQGLYENPKIVCDPEWEMEYFPAETLLDTLTQSDFLDF